MDKTKFRTNREDREFEDKLVAVSLVIITAILFAVGIVIAKHLFGNLSL